MRGDGIKHPRKFSVLSSTTTLGGKVGPDNGHAYYLGSVTDEATLMSCPHTQSCKGSPAASHIGQYHLGTAQGPDAIGCYSLSIGRL